MHDTLQDYLSIMCAAARKAGEIVKRHYLSELLEVRKKNAQGDLVSSADLDAEREILTLLRSKFPAAVVVAEESGGSLEPGTVFYVDPVDGTLNYVHGIPFFAVSIGCWIDGTPATGVVLNPLNGDLYTTVRGAGAAKNGKLMTVSAAPSLSESLIATGWPYDRAERARLFSEMDRLYMQSQELRTLGCASLALCMVAEGALDGYWEWDLKPWDMAAGTLIVTEAGGTVSSLTGGELDLGSGKIIASNGRIHQELVHALQLHQ